MKTGEVWVNIQVAAGPEGPWKEVRVLADTGATLPFIPATVLDSLGVRPVREIQISLANGSQVGRRLGFVFVRFNGDETPCRVIFAEPEDAPLLGLTALEQLGLAVDPINRELISVGFRAYRQSKIFGIPLRAFMQVRPGDVKRGRGTK